MRIAILMAGMALTAGMTMAAAGASAQTTLRLACPSAADTPTCQAAQHFADEVQTRTDGGVTVNVHPAGQLGTGRDAIVGMQTGSIDLVVEELVNYSDFVTDYGILGWGFAFVDRAHLEQFLTSDIHAEMRAELADQNIELLAYEWQRLPRAVVSSTPIFTVEDLGGLRFRVPEIRTFIATWENLGANPQSVPWGEAYLALRQGTVDAMESPFDTIAGQGFHEAAPYVSLTNHVQSVLSLAMNKGRYDGLDADQKAAFEAAVESTNAFIADRVQELHQETIDTITADGAFVIHLNTEAFADRLAETGEQLAEEGLWSPGLLQEIRDLRN